MSGINTETVVMVGAALAGAGQVQAHDGVRADEGTISWEEAQKMALIADLKAQCANMSDGVQRVLDTYDLDKLKEVKATLKADGQKFNYMIEGNQYSLSGGFDGKPLNMEVKGLDGSRFQSSQGENYSSAAVFDENGQMTAMVQKDERTGNVVGRFQDGATVLNVAQKGQRIDANLHSEDMQFGISKAGNRVSMQAEGADLGKFAGTVRMGRNGAFSAQATYDDGAHEGADEFKVKVSQNGNMKFSAQVTDEYGIKDELKAQVKQHGYSMTTVEDGEKEVETGTEVNAAMLKAMMQKRMVR